MDLSGQLIKGTGSYEIKELTAQDSVLKELDKGQQYFECTSAGTIAWFQPNAYGTGRFWLYKGADSNALIVFFISSNHDLSSYVGTYGLALNIDESVRFLVAGSSGAGFSSAASYIKINTWYELEWDRTKSGQFTTYIRGGDFIEWTQVVADSGANPFTETSYTKSIYQVFDLDVGDKFIPGLIQEGVLQ